MTLGTFLIILAAIDVNEGIVMGRILLCVAASGVVLRVLADGTLFNMVGGGVYGLVPGALLFRKAIKREGHIYILPPQAQLLAIGGLCTGASGFPMFFIASL